MSVVGTMEVQVNMAISLVGKHMFLVGKHMLFVVSGIDLGRTDCTHQAVLAKVYVWQMFNTIPHLKNFIFILYIYLFNHKG